MGLGVVQKGQAETFVFHQDTEQDWTRERPRVCREEIESEKHEKRKSESNQVNHIKWKRGTKRDYAGDVINNTVGYCFLTVLRILNQS